jgi:hypothetical protein
MGWEQVMLAIIDDLGGRIPCPFWDSDRWWIKPKGFELKRSEH